jgi:hypothetical protein
METKLVQIFVLLSICSLFFIGCENRLDTKGKPITLTHKESLEFLVTKSDIIALVTISGGTDKPKPLFLNSPDRVYAEIHSIIKGNEDRKTIELLSEPKYLNPNVISAKIILRNGYHLIFACNNKDYYQPTTEFSLNQINNNRVWPIWRPDQYKEIGPNGEKASKGLNLDEVIKDIKEKLKKS